MNVALAGLALANLLAQGGGWTEAPPLPRPVANNAVVAAETAEGPAVFSFLGLDETRRWDGVGSAAFRWTVGDAVWMEVAPVPGPGRLAGTAQAVGGRVYLFGGYTVAEDGTERSVPHVDIYDPDADAWSRAAPMPVPVDDAVSGVWRDSLVFLVSGWHDTDNVDLVQVYDPESDTWQRATPIPGAPVFGHAGGIAGDAIVYLGGAAVTEESPRFQIEASAWRGDIDPDDPTHISWRRLEDHPGPPLYRAAGGSHGDQVLFVGGTDNPYNYDGIGYDGVPSSPLAAFFGYDVSQDRWVTHAPLTVPTMDHRSVVVARGQLVLAGGMLSRQRVTDRVVIRRTP
jgi:N-acetylneuraminic acid mutarotase